ncbi:endonuclease domain-containing protein [Parerythrobacter aestuarii]|uniref:endonuclease domain-containing protein n=1 Tax=Parerythrobacter aestuarii TaxID=3020909 RepID=UPI0024DEF95D|nr:endonuclease domain-containing protein [Parerythrobacter aestuarii]
MPVGPPPFEDKGYKRPTLRSRELRMNATEPERVLWQHLRSRQLAGVRFNRQFPIGQFICDFVARGPRLVIELDGGTHASDEAHEADACRTRFLHAQGYTVIRFWNHEVMDNVEGVLRRIEQTLADMPSPSPSRKREGSLWSPSRRERADKC